MRIRTLCFSLIIIATAAFSKAVETRELLTTAKGKRSGPRRVRIITNLSIQLGALNRSQVLGLCADQDSITWIGIIFNRIAYRDIADAHMIVTLGWFRLPQNGSQYDIDMEATFRSLLASISGGLGKEK